MLIEQIIEFESKNLAPLVVHVLLQLVAGVPKPGGMGDISLPII